MKKRKVAIGMIVVSLMVGLTGCGTDLNKLASTWENKFINQAPNEQVAIQDINQIVFDDISYGGRYEDDTYIKGYKIVVNFRFDNQKYAETIRDNQIHKVLLPGQASYAKFKFIDITRQKDFQDAFNYVSDKLDRGPHNIQVYLPKDYIISEKNIMKHKVGEVVKN